MNTIHMDTMGIVSLILKQQPISVSNDLLLSRVIDIDTIKLIIKEQQPSVVICPFIEKPEIVTLITHPISRLFLFLRRFRKECMQHIHIFLEICKKERNDYCSEHIHSEHIEKSFYRDERIHVDPLYAVSESIHAQHMQELKDFCFVYGDQIVPTDGRSFAPSILEVGRSPTSTE